MSGTTAARRRTIAGLAAAAPLLLSVALAPAAAAVPPPPATFNGVSLTGLCIAGFAAVSADAPTLAALAAAGIAVRSVTALPGMVGTTVSPVASMLSAALGIPVPTSFFIQPQSAARGFLVFGSADDDLIVTRSGTDFVCGLAGDDIIITLSGNDEVIGGAGSDVIYTGSGNDRTDLDAADLLCDSGSGDDAGC